MKILFCFTPFFTTPYTSHIPKVYIECSESNACHRAKLLLYQIKNSRKLWLLIYLGIYFPGNADLPDVDSNKKKKCDYCPSPPPSDNQQLWLYYTSMSIRVYIRYQNRYISHLKDGILY